MEYQAVGVEALYSTSATEYSLRHMCCPPLLPVRHGVHFQVRRQVETQFKIPFLALIH
jgi:hypothetical protein